MRCRSIHDNLVTSFILHVTKDNRSDTCPAIGLSLAISFVLMSPVLPLAPNKNYLILTFQGRNITHNCVTAVCDHFYPDIPCGYSVLYWKCV